MPEANIGNLERDRDQLWAEAAYREAHSEAIHLTEADEKAALGISNVRKQHEAGDEIHNALALWASGKGGTPYSGNAMPLKEIARQALEISIRGLRKDMEMRIASSLKRLGFEKKESHGITRWKR